MSRKSTLSTVLLVAGIGFLIAPALVPVQPTLIHDTTRGTIGNVSDIRADGYEIIAYENLSERGQQLYVQTLRSGGTYSVPVGEGAPDFRYPTPGELGETESYRERSALQGIVIERPSESNLPPPDEDINAAEQILEHRQRVNESESEISEAELRRQVGRYDLMMTRTARPPLQDPMSLAHLGIAALGVLAIGTGGYFRSKP